MSQEHDALVAAHQFVDNFVLGVFGEHRAAAVTEAIALRTQLGRAIDVSQKAADALAAECIRCEPGAIQCCGAECPVLRPAVPA